MPTLAQDLRTAARGETQRHNTNTAITLNGDRLRILRWQNNAITTTQHTKLLHDALTAARENRWSCKAQFVFLQPKRGKHRAAIDLFDITGSS